MNVVGTLSLSGSGLCSFRLEIWEALYASPNAPCRYVQLTVALPNVRHNSRSRTSWVYITPISSLHLMDLKPNALQSWYTWQRKKLLFLQKLVLLLVAEFLNVLPLWLYPEFNFCLSYFQDYFMFRQLIWVLQGLCIAAPQLHNSKPSCPDLNLSFHLHLILIPILLCFKEGYTIDMLMHKVLWLFTNAEISLMTYTNRA